MVDRVMSPAGAPLGGGGGLAQLPAAQTVHSLSRLVRYQQYRAFYNGDQWDDLPAPGERRLTFNYARVFINKAASYLMGKPVGYLATATGGRPGPRKQAAARVVEAYLAEVAAFNTLAALDLDTAIAAGTLGDGAWTVRWDPVARLPRVTAVDPLGLDARWRADDLQTLLWLRQTYWTCAAELTPAQRGRRAAGGGGPDDPYRPLRAREEWTPQAWALYVDDVAVDGGPNPYGQIPYILFPNLRVPGEFWGEGDLADLLRLQRELNARLSIFSRILEVAGNPVAVVTGADADSTETLKLGPNQLWTLPEGAKAEVLDLLKAGGADAHLKYIDTVYRALHDISEMPRTSFGDSSHSRQARSGVALEIELQPLLHKLARKRAYFGTALERRAALILAIARVHGVALPAVRLTLAWPPVLPQDRTTLVQQEVQLVAAGIHPPTLAMAALNDPDPDQQLLQVLAEARQLQQAGLGARPHPPAAGGGGDPAW
ncbi:MAG TPA: phage portal protein [Chloroflexia bacterium]|nr:phage portal protein [Chloroflexia bacterium]